MRTDPHRRVPRYIAPTYFPRKRAHGWRDWQISTTQIIVIAVGLVFAGVFGTSLF